MSTDSYHVNMTIIAINRNETKCPQHLPYVHVSTTAIQTNPECDDVNAIIVMLLLPKEIATGYSHAVKRRHN